NGERFDRFSYLVFQKAMVRAMEHQRQRTVAEEVAVYLKFRKRIAELANCRRRRIVDQHVLWTGVRRDVVHDRDPFVEEMPAPGLKISSHPIVWNALPFKARNEFPSQRREIAQDVRKRVRGWLFHREHFDEPMTHDEVVAVAVDRGVGDEVIQM